MNIYAPLDPYVPWVFQAAALAIALLLLTAWVVRRQLGAANGGLVPDAGVTVRNTLEVVVEALGYLARDNMGPDYRRWFPVVGAIFFFILFSNLLGLVPFLDGATSDVNTGAAWAIISFVTYNYVGLRAHGAKYVKQFMGPIPALAPVFLILEPPLHVARMVTLTIRLLANMFADHTIIAVWLVLVPFLVPALFMGLGLVIAVLQAFVFTLLTMVYIGLALEEEH